MSVENSVRDTTGSPPALGKVRGIIWDLDGTLYRYNPQCREQFSRLGATLAVEAGVPGTIDAIQAEWKTRGREYRLIPEWQEKYGLDFAQFHARFHEICDESNVVIPMLGVTEAVLSLEIPQVILTHAGLSWARRVLERLGMSCAFSDERIIDLAAAGFVFKRETPDPFVLALQRLGLSAPDVLMIEDSAANLVHAHALGMMTALVNHGSPLNPQPEYVDIQHENPLGVLERVYTLRTNTNTPDGCRTNER